MLSQGNFIVSQVIRKGREVESCTEWSGLRIFEVFLKKRIVPVLWAMTIRFPRVLHAGMWFSAFLVAGLPRIRSTDRSWPSPTNARSEWITWMASYVGRTALSLGPRSFSTRYPTENQARKERETERERKRDKCLEWPISRVLSFNASSDPAVETNAHKKRRKGREIGIKKSSVRGLRLTGPSGIRQPRYDFVRLPISMRDNVPPRKVTHMLGMWRKM